MAGYLAPQVARRIAENLARLRAARNVSQQEIANAIGLKNPSVISAWETGLRTPNVASVRKLAHYFTVLIDEIDPDREAWDPERPRAERKLQKSHAQTDTPAVAPHSPRPEAGVLMDAGGLLDIPDAELFRKVLGVWLSLDSPAERVEFLKHARAFTPGSAKAKNVRR